MRTRHPAIPVLGLLAAALLSADPAVSGEPDEPDGRAERPPAWVDAQRLRAADQEPGSWLAHGRTHDEQRFSPLGQVHVDNVENLGLAWSFELGTRRGVETTPLVIDGVMYATAPWSVVHALDAATGRRLWTYDPKVPPHKGRNACCDVVNRGLAAWKGRLYLGTIDGRLVAIDAATGEPVWETLTVDPSKPYTITGAPRVAEGRVFIGNGGGEFGVRGYVGAYDAATGELLWRFYTVPASATGPHEHPELETAARTWSKTSLFEAGLGGTVWDSLTYDPELDLLYVGVGNSSVYDRGVRSPGGGDNLFLASILALRPATGRLVWHYQTTPGEHWDYTATQHMVLADLEIGGRTRKVLMQAPKNGFFYVLDRENGELLSAEKYVEVSWASRVDPASGRPVERTEALWSEKPAMVMPGVSGGHNWHPMSFSPETGLVYIPSIEMPYPYRAERDFRFEPQRYNTGEDFEAMATELEGYEELARAVCSPTQLTAWDPVAATRRWRVEFDTAVPGGVLSTAGGLVFQGNGSGNFAAYDARTGERRFAARVGVGMMAPPISYAVDGTQYVAVAAGVGGSAGGHFTRFSYENEGRILAFKLGGEEPMPPLRQRPAPRPEPPAVELSPQEVARGRALYAEHCFRCHGLGVKSSGLYPDLRHASAETHELWDAIVRGGLRADRGMASFADVLSQSESKAIHAYVIERARHEPGVLERLGRYFADHACVPGSWLVD